MAQQIPAKLIAKVFTSGRKYVLALQSLKGGESSWKQVLDDAYDKLVTEAVIVAEAGETAPATPEQDQVNAVIAEIKKQIVEICQS
ncbi:MAG TPA: hypothetical protein PKZ07_14730 [Sedimentisphaerales bacterium]|nr:hypothetical protein [Sedimentisphaerales bacterium]